MCASTLRYKCMLFIWHWIYICMVWSMKIVVLAPIVLNVMCMLVALVERASDQQSVAMLQFVVMMWKHTHIYIYRYICSHVCAYTYTYIQTHLYTNVGMSAYTHIYTYIILVVCSCMCVCMQSCNNECMYLCILVCV